MSDFLHHAIYGGSHIDRKLEEMSGQQYKVEDSNEIS